MRKSDVSHVVPSVFIPKDDSGLSDCTTENECSYDTMGVMFDHLLTNLESGSVPVNPYKDDWESDGVWRRFL